ncbi:PAS domain-containing protein [Natronobacterium gregoryi]|uniref:PAS domain S-box n=2 Tax=Natronobacterium gregoryi TaxID=44930 RepID=L0AHQ2_NATGS|nr:PAS domain-containing protein [Natronobacterium gregoryi]AFZ72974.1 PAS domain S-box [Natronobacterium gregoryi SP2]ELY69878.1 PAS sensor protein [Natronobacterium gregoryi SP2]PLK21941.1 PAS domain-containing protein [Natronobacterium gregoryi SP2]SFI68863.1 PAS domain S-box-containing protein [Natronobacterium gregoryi]
MLGALSIAETRNVFPTDDESLTALVIGDGFAAERLETDQETSPIVEISTAVSLSAALEQLADVDCLVCRQPPEDATLEETIDRVRRRRAELPVLVVADESWLTMARDETADHQWTDVVADGPTVDQRLRYRLPRLVERKRLSTLSQRSLAGIELAGDAIATVDPDGAIEFPNHSFAVEFGADRDGLIGQPWQDLFEPATAERLASTAIPTVEDGWRWTGTCTGRRTDGTEFSARVSIGGLEDGSLVFVVETPADDETTTG